MKCLPEGFTILFVEWIEINFIAQYGIILFLNYLGERSIIADCFEPKSFMSMPSAA